MINDIVNLKIETKATQDSIVELAKNIFPEFKWRQGNSDMMGRYLSGSNEDGVGIKIWFDEIPYDISISFSIIGEDIKEQVKQLVMEKINKIFIPTVQDFSA